MRSLGESACYKILAKDITTVFGVNLSGVLSQNLLMTQLGSHELFSQLPLDVLDTLSHAAKVLENHNSGQIIAIPGEEHKKGFYFVAEGEAEFCDSDGSKKRCAKNEYHCLEYLCNPKLSFHHTIMITADNTTVLCLSLDIMKEKINNDSLVAEISYQKTVGLLKNIFIFRHMRKEQLDKIVGAFEVRKLKKDDPLIVEGQMGNEMYLLMTGQVAISKGGDFIVSKKSPTYVGERALMYDEPRSASCTVSSDECEVWALSKAVFLEVMQNDASLMEHLAERTALQSSSLHFHDLIELKVVGRGGYGVVKMVEHATTKMRYALKAVERAPLGDSECQAIINEKKVMMDTDHPMMLEKRNFSL